MNEEIINSLINKIWITRKCRINTSERLILTNTIAQLFINYFTLVVLSISIWTLYSESDNNHLSFITVVASLFLFAGTIGVNTLNFKERIAKIKNCYIQLDNLIADLEILKNDLPNLDRSDSKLKFEGIREGYSKILEDVENHNSYDYIKFQLSQNEYRSLVNYTRYYLYTLGYILIVLILILVPFLPLIFIL
jgi:hypothetical protein